MEKTPEQNNDYNAKYFAAKDAKDLAANCLAKGQSFFNLLRANAYLEKLQFCWRFYNGAYNNDLGFGHRITFTGEQGEIVNLPVNHFRNIAQHMLTMITANRPIMEARAMNNDYKSMSQTYLANGILDYYMREKKLEDYIKTAVEMCIVLGSGFIKMEWNATSGDLYDFDPETGEANYEGELEFSNLSPFDVIFDGTKETWQHDWILTRSFKNRHNLMAKYPELAEKLKGVTPKNQSAVYRLAVWSNDDTDDIPVYEFYHKRTEAMPEGRYMLFCDSDIVLLDAKMPYRDIPIYRIAPSTILGTPYGYTPMFDIFPIQEAINATYGAIMTNQNAFAVQNVFVQRGSDISMESLPGGLNIIEGNAPPSPINLTQTPAEVFKFLEVMIQAAETISGVNSVSRGNPEASLKSGNALALVQSMALQFMSGLQQSYVRLIEDIGTSLINILKDFATTPKMVALVGKNNRPLLKEFVGDDINSINRVVVDIGNPLSRTTAGRVQMAEQLLQMKLLKNPDQYFQVINTGRLDVTFQGETGQLMLIQAENEKLLEGKSPQAAPTDLHAVHISEHSHVLNDPDLREDQNLVKVVMDHIESHMNFLEQTDPRLLQLLNQQPIPPLEMALSGPPPSGPQGGPPPGNQGMPSGPMQPNPDQIAPGQQINSEIAGSQNLPNLPKPPGEFKNMPVTAEQMGPRQ